ncbi:MAG: hypothetical protein AAF512_13400, partial [Pseudomonadota bacterium]
KKTQITSAAILVDSIREEYHLNTIPHVMGSDRRAMLERRMIRLFSGAEYTYAWTQGKQPNSAGQGRVDDRVLFMALPESDALLKPWLQRLADLQTPVVGIYSLPLSSQNLLSKANISHKYILLVGNTPEINDYSANGLRQSFFVNQQLYVSRLTSLNSLEPEQYMQDAVQEIHNTQQYIYGTGHANADDEAIQVVWLLSGELLDVCRTYIGEKPPLGLQYQFIDLVQFAKKFGLSQFNTLAREPMLCDLMSYTLARNTPPNHYARREDQKYFSYQRWRRNIYLGGTALLLSVGTAAGMNLQNGLELQNQADRLAEKKARTDQAHDRIQQKQRGLYGFSENLDVKFIKSTVDAAEYIEQRDPEPRQAFTRLGLALKEAMQLELGVINWRLVERSKTFVKKDESEVSAEETSQFASRISSLRRNTPVTESVDLVELMELHGQVKPATTETYKKTAAWDTINQFVERLKLQPDVLGAQIVESPVNLGGTSSLSSKRTDKDELKFKVAVVLKPSYSVINDE